MTGKRFEVMDYFDSENKPIKAIRDTETTEIYSMDNELEANSTCGLLNALHEENIMLKQKIDRQLHRNKRYSRQNEEVMGFLHDNYYSIWEEVLKECYHD